MPKVSLIAAFYNRVDYLERAVRSALDQTASPDAFEVLVVDNCSTDDTRALVESLQPIGNVRYMYEPRLGLCHARNAGWRNAAGDYVAYLDDDAIASRDWIAAILEAFSSLPAIGIVPAPRRDIWLENLMMHDLASRHIAKAPSGQPLQLVEVALHGGLGGHRSRLR